MRYDYKYRINNKDKGDLAMELKENNSKLKVKVLAPAVTKTNF